MKVKESFLLQPTVQLFPLQLSRMMWTRPWLSRYSERAWLALWRSLMCLAEMAEMAEMAAIAACCLLSRMEGRVIKWDSSYVPTLEETSILAPRYDLTHVRYYRYKRLLCRCVSITIWRALNCTSEVQTPDFEGYLLSVSGGRKSVCLCREWKKTSSLFAPRLSDVNALIPRNYWLKKKGLKSYC